MFVKVIREDNQCVIQCTEYTLTPNEVGGFHLMTFDRTNRVATDHPLVPEENVRVFAMNDTGKTIETVYESRPSVNAPT